MNPIIRHLTVQCIDLAVLSYAGACIQRFDVDFLNSDISVFKIPVKFRYYEEALREISSWPSFDHIYLRRRRLQCLDEFLGANEFWVFHRSIGHDNDNGRLYLSAAVEELTDLWDSFWKIVQNEDLNFIRHYDIGNGSILPWSVPSGDEVSSVKLYDNEVFSHWISSRNMNTMEIQEHQKDLPRRHFLKSDRLLIGASPGFGLSLNEECVATVETLLTIKDNLRQKQALRERNTYRPQRYIDSHAVQIQGSALEIISSTTQVTYKRRKGHTMKDTLVERWRNGLRNPMDLEAYSGVEISLCTRNARRQRLLYLLNSPTVHNYLRGIGFEWQSESCRDAYFKALKCPKAFRKFWKSHGDCRVNIGDAISTCLDALEETGVNADNQELSALWVESFDEHGDSDGESDGESISDEGDKQLQTRPNFDAAVAEYKAGVEEWIVTLFRSEHTWSGFLVDSEESLTMAIIGPACLDFNDNAGIGRRCLRRLQGSLAPGLSWYEGYPVLQTSLLLNQSILKHERRIREKANDGQNLLDGKHFKKNASFPLGDHGSLTVCSGPTRSYPVVMEWNPVLSNLCKELKNKVVNEKLLGRSHERHHLEYIRGKWEVKPVPILVLSKSTKTRFSKD